MVSCSPLSGRFRDKDLLRIPVEQAGCDQLWLMVHFSRDVGTSGLVIVHAGRIVVPFIWDVSGPRARRDVVPQDSPFAFVRWALG